jgi:hypothetical protein
MSDEDDVVTFVNSTPVVAAVNTGGTTVIVVAPGQVGGGLPSTLINGNAGSLLITAEKVWLNDPLLAGAPADNTGAAFVNTVFNAAIAKALTYSGSGKPVISGPPGIYKWDTTKSCLAIPSGVRFSMGSGTVWAATFSFPTDTTLPTAIGTCTTGTTLGQATVSVTNVKNTFPTASVGNPQYALFQGVVFSYTGVSQSSHSATLTGCVGIPAASSYPQMVVGGSCAILIGHDTIENAYVLDQSIIVTGPGSGSPAWATATPPTGAMDGIFVGGGGSINCSVSSFRQNIMYGGDHETFGGNIYLGGGWCNYACESPYQFPQSSYDTGNQTWKTGAQDSGGVYWCHHFITAGNTLAYANFEPQVAMGNCPWVFWKDATLGVTGSAPAILNNVWFDVPTFEAIALGIVGCPDGNGSMGNVRIKDGGCNWAGTRPAGFSQPVAAFACNFQDLIVDNFQGLTGVPSGFSPPLWIADQAIGRFVNLPISLAATNPPQTYTSGVVPIARVVFDGGTVDAGVSGNIAIGSAVAPRYKAQVSYETAFEHQRSDGTPRPLTGIALAAETATNLYVVQATNRNAGQVAVKVLSQNTPPTSPTATTSGTAGTRAAGTWYYKFEHVLSGGGVTGLSTEASVALSGSNSAAVGWTNLVTIPHGQTITATRIWVGSSSGGQTGYITQAGTGTSYTDSGAALTTATPPSPNQNVGCEIYFTGGNTCYVRDNGATSPGALCIATGPYDTNGDVIGVAINGYNGPDDGSKAVILIIPARN